MVESKMSDNASLNQSVFTMTDKKICYFKGEDNKVMILDLKSEQWSEKTIDEPGFKFE